MKEHTNNIVALSKLSENAHRLLMSSSLEINLEKNDYLYRKGAQKKFVFVVLSGSIKLFVKINVEKSIIKDILHKNDLFGENIYAAKTHYLEDAKALESSRILKIPMSLFEQLIKNEPAFAIHVAELMMQRISSLEKRIKDFIFVSAKKRIVAFLYQMGSIKGIKIGIDECLVHLKLSHREIASITDTSRQTVARVFSELKKDNVVHFSPRKPNKILLRNVAM